MKQRLHVKYGLCLLLLFQGVSFYGQGALGNYNLAATNFMSLYNNGDYVGIFGLFDADMKKALPQQNTISFFSQNVKAKMGNIQDMQFLEFKNGAHVYRTYFDKATADILISLNPNNKINGLYISPPKPLTIPILDRNLTPMQLPFNLNEEWFVFWGGTTEAQNYHVNEVSQRYAYDLLMVSNGKSFEGDPLKNESYFAFGKEILAPCNAQVIKVITGVKDNIPGETNPEQLTGNTVVLETPNKEYVLFAHLMEGSIAVTEGQMVAQGTVLGKCGNSGNSTEPHLHLSLQNTVDMEDATGAMLFFNQLWVNGELRTDYLPVKEDFIKNSNN
ncbi:peptidoglycan DD-metalloendopeptidase family protein [Arenibacter sp. GZD96]|uniref:peptidoglycan DD-metalloendopeptidase family protein n=1 Tax=Aurantibrevibacter litoralis TaxID=3106030 RepID=UPI002AFF7380|nr:peptidoglycan DD-metalloendopeptidase family protein [Arenibacter sp. GZD-96]MEA1784537.1 peptidoglycan DD-metalloendopeptidase family protein [Arenibacter sp. GZD-96]